MQGRANSLLPQKTRKLDSPNLDEIKGCQCLGHSNWTICSLLSQFYFPNFTTFSLLYWEANSYYPREKKAENGKIEFSQPECDKRFWVPGAFKLDHLQPVKPILFPKFFQLFHFHTGRPFLITPEG